MRTDITVDIGAPPEVVWAVIWDLESWPEWTASVTSVRRLSSERRQVGSRVRLTQPRLPVTGWTVSDLVKGEQFTRTADSPGMRTRAFHRVAGRADGSQATLWIDQGGVLGSVVGLRYGGLIRRYLQLEAAGLQQRCEESAARHRV